MNSYCIQSLSIACLFSCIIAPALGYFAKAIINQTINEAKLSYIERDSYKQLFDALLEGILVVQDNQITFMNMLANQIISDVTTMSNFLMKEYRPGTEKKDHFDRMSVTLFYLIDNQNILD